MVFICFCIHIYKQYTAIHLPYLIGAKLVILFSNLLKLQSEFMYHSFISLWKPLLFITKRHYSHKCVVKMQSTFPRHSVRAKPSKVKNDVLDSLMANHIFHPVHLLLKCINYQINWLLFTATYKRAHPFTLPSSFPLATVRDSHLQRIIRLQSCIILGWEYYTVDFMLGN